MNFAFNSQLIAYYATWIVTSIYFLALIPQIVLNYKLKSASGLTDSMLLIYFIAYAADSIYAHFLNLPISYRIMIPGAFMAVMVIVFQRLYYASEYGSKKFVQSLYFIISIICFILLIGLYDRTISGWFAGLVAMVSFAIAYIPQIVRVHMTKSVHGVSPFFISMLGTACAIEFVSAFFIGLPLPSFIDGFRGMIVSIIVLIQFWMYRKPFVVAENPILEETQLQ